METKNAIIYQIQTFQVTSLGLACEGTAMGNQ